MGWLWAALLIVLSAMSAHGQMLTADLEVKTVASVGYAWQTVALENSYFDPIIVCTHRLNSDADPSAITRIRNITSTSFQLKIQQFEDSASVTATDVYCIISDEGAYNAGGLKYEARKVVAPNTAGNTVPNSWNAANRVNVSANVTQTYTTPVVLAQVMSANDNRASAPWVSDCENRGNRPFQSGMSDGMCIGKHIGQINSTRASETMGWFVVESGSGTVNDIAFTAALGADTGGGVGNNPPYSYSVSGDFDMGVLTQAGEDGGQGGWAVFYGADPLPNSSVRWAIEEEVVAGDTSRTHTTEQVGYWLFDNSQTPTLSAAKSVAMSTQAASPYAVPGSDVIYEIGVTNAGSGPVDSNSLFLTDALPAEVIFYNGDIDGPGPETAAVVLVDSGSNVTLGAADIGFALTAPTTFADCSYTPAAGYDPAVRYLCFAPKGAMDEGTITPSNFAIRFRVQIN